ncbi:MAG TPA: MmcQ/YjbR family DNA-binding protein [Myxococcus sp.]|nr:MmcQ/YjbR family DNA-binding protein [Myxococcus sp.]
MSHAPSDKVDPKLKAAEDRLREVSLAFPEVTEEFPWGHRTVKVKGKMFVILTLDNEALGVTTKLPASNEAALMLPFAEPTGYGLGKSGWVSARFKPGDAVPVELLTQWIHESFRAVAPQKVLKQLGGGGTEAPAKAKKTPAAKKPAVKKVAAKKAPAAAAKKKAPAARRGMAAARSSR